MVEAIQCAGPQLRRYPASAFLSGSPHFILAIMKSSIERAAGAVIGYRETADQLDRVLQGDRRGCHAQTFQPYPRAQS
jgi:hypothetical protein